MTPGCLPDQLDAAGASSSGPFPAFMGTGPGPADVSDPTGQLRPRKFSTYIQQQEAFFTPLPNAQLEVPGGVAYSYSVRLNTKHHLYNDTCNRRLWLNTHK